MQCRFDNFDEYTRRQYNAKAPHITNPFGQEEVPLKFLDFDVFQKLRVLHQLSVWTFWNADRIRDKMPEKKETEQLQWVCCIHFSRRRFACPSLTFTSALKNSVLIAMAGPTMF